MVYTLTVYTYGVLDRFAGFEWDVHNVRHIALHGVSPADVEDAVTNRNVVIPAGPGKTGKRWKLIGRTAAGPYLVIVFTGRRGRFRTVTAYTMNQSERKLYAPEIES